MACRAAADFDTDLDGESDLSPQPRPSGIQFPRRNPAADGSFYRDGAEFTVWTFDYMTHTHFSTFNTTLGLSDTTPNVEVSIRTLTNDFDTYDDYNALVSMPEPEEDYQHDRDTYLNVRYTFRRLEAQ